MDSLAAVCFDLDGTLCVSDQDPDRLLDAAFAAADVDPCFGASDLESVDASELPTAETDRGFYEGYFAAAAGEAAASLDDRTIAALAGAYLERLDPTAVRPRSGALEALEAARERYPVALVTNGAERTQSRKLEAIGCADAFDATVFCDPANGIEPKPDPAPLERALEALGVPANRTLLVGDSVGSDVAGASAVGMRSAWVPLAEPEGPPAPEPDHVLSGMDRLSELL